MNKIIPIDKETRIRITSQDYILQRKKRNKSKKRITWKYEGYFPDLMSLSNYYINSAPYRVMNATGQFQELIEVVKSAEKKIESLIINLKQWHLKK